MSPRSPAMTGRRPPPLRGSYGSCTAQPRKKRCSWVRVRPAAEWNYDHTSTGILLDEPLHQRLRLFVQDLNRMYVTERALQKWTSTPRASSGSTATTTRTASSRSHPPRARTAALRGRRREFHFPFRATANRIGVPAARHTSSSSTATARCTADQSREQRRRVHRADRVARPADSLRLNLPPPGSCFSSRGGS